jgi:hypothetical protein
MSDQIMQDQQDGQDALAKKRVPKGQRIPQATATDVIPMVEALASFNGPASKKMVAGSMGLTAGGGAFEGKWAATGYYGFREDAGKGRFQVSERGHALVGDDAERVLEAKQHALVSTGFRTILDRFSTNPVNLAAIEAALEEDLGVPDVQVKKVAKLLVKSAEEAEMVIDNRFQVAAIEPAIEAVGEFTVTASPKPANKATASAKSPANPAETRRQTPTPRVPAPIVQEVKTEGPLGPLGVSVKIEIDARHHTPEEIGEIMRQVQQALISVG